MDFVGQKGPTSKTHLILLDFLVLILQLLNLGVLSISKKAKASAEGATVSPTNESTARESTVSRPQQTLDFEERGLLRADEQAVDIELQNLNSEGQAVRHEVEDDAHAESAEQEEEAALLRNTQVPRSDGHIFDAFNSGEIMIADLNLITVAKEHLLNLRQPLQDAAASSATNNISAASFTGSGLNLRMRIGNRIWGI